MNLLRAYIVEGKSVRDLAAASGDTEPQVRAALEAAGIRIKPGRQRGVVCAAVAWLGLGSFAAFAQQHGTDTLRCQALVLGVPKAALRRVYTIFRDLAVAEAQTNDAAEPEPERA